MSALFGDHVLFMQGVLGALKSAPVADRESLLLPVLQRAPGGCRRVGSTLADTLAPYKKLLADAGLDDALRDVTPTQKHDGEGRR